MKSRRDLHGLMGLLSPPGFIGVFTDERAFLAFFAFEYFFVKTAEMLEEQMDKSASRAFYCGAVTTAIAALLYGFASGWGVCATVDGFLIGYYKFKESQGTEYDKNRAEEYRAKQDMKQEHLAKLVGVRRETMGNLERGRYNPSLALAWNIAKPFGAAIEEIFGVED